MSKRSKLCYSCEEYEKIPIYYRDEKRVFKVAFYVCRNCMHFSGFSNWTKMRFMPYFNEMRGMVMMRLAKKQKDKPGDQFTLRKHVLLMANNPYAVCRKCKKTENSKLYLRNRETNLFDFIGYLCKNCRIGTLVNTDTLKFQTMDPRGHELEDGSLPNYHDIPFDEYIGQFSTQIGEDEEIPKPRIITIQIDPKDITKLKKSKINFEYYS